MARSLDPLMPISTSNGSRVLLPIDGALPHSFDFSSASPSQGVTRLPTLPQIGSRQLWVEPIQENDSEAPIVEKEHEHDASDVCHTGITSDKMLHKDIRAETNSIISRSVDDNVAQRCKATDEPKVSFT